MPSAYVFSKYASSLWSGTLDCMENIVVNVREHLRRPSDRQAPLKPEHNLSGKVCLITGGNAGIGYATAKMMAERGAHLVIACRSAERGNKAAQELQAVAPLPGCAPPKVEVLSLDLASLASVRSFCKAFNSKKLPLDILICNAGLMSPPQRLTTQDGLEMQFQVNFLGHWMLTNELMAEQRQRRHSRQQKQKQASEAGGTRVVFVSSLTHPAGATQWGDFQSERSYSPFASYGLSKLCNIIAAREFNSRFASHPGYGSDSAVSIHPGVVDTHLSTSFFKSTGSTSVPVLTSAVNFFVDRVGPMMMRTPSSSATSMLHAATAPSSEVAGRYLFHTRVNRPDEFAEEQAHAVELWTLATRLTGITLHSSMT